MSLFGDLRKRVESGGNSNFWFDKLDWRTSIWIKGMCDFIDENYDRKKKPECTDDCSTCEFEAACPLVSNQPGALNPHKE